MVRSLVSPVRTFRWVVASDEGAYGALEDGVLAQQIPLAVGSEGVLVGVGGRFLMFEDQFLQVPEGGKHAALAECSVGVSLVLETGDASVVPADYFQGVNEFP